MKSGAGAKIQWSIVSSKVHSELKILLGRLDVEKLGFEELDPLMQAIANKRSAAKHSRRIESLESDFQDKIAKEIGEIICKRAPNFLYLLFHHPELQGVYKIKPEETSALALKFVLLDGNLITLVDSELSFGFLIDLEFMDEEQIGRIEYEAWLTE